MDLSSLAGLENEPGALLSELSRHVSDNPTILEIKKTNKWLEQNAAKVVSGLPRPRVAILTEQTLEGLREPFTLFARLEGFAADLLLCPPYFPEMQFISPTSDLAEHRPDITFVFLDIEKRSAFTSLALDEQAFSEFATRLEAAVGLMSRFAERTGSKIAVANFIAIWPPLALLKETDPRAGRVSFLQRANDLLQERCTAARLPVLPLSSHLAIWGYRRCIDLREYCNTDTAFTAEGFNRIARLMAAHLSEQFRPRRTLLIIDPEGALWGRSVDPETADVAYSPDNYPGRMFHRAMKWMQELSSTGVRLALAGSGDSARLMSLLDRDDFLLHRDQFSAIISNDEPVNAKISHMLLELGVSPEQAVFLSSSQEDCTRARRECPGLATVAVPSNLGEYLVALSSVPCMGRRT